MTSFPVPTPSCRVHWICAVCATHPLVMSCHLGYQMTLNMAALMFNYPCFLFSFCPGQMMRCRERPVQSTVLGLGARASHGPALGAYVLVGRVAGEAGSNKSTRSLQCDSMLSSGRQHLSTQWRVSGKGGNIFAGWPGKGCLSK
jgi:hypothetical protein